MKRIGFLSLLLLLLVVIGLLVLPNKAQAVTGGSCGEELTWTLDNSGTLTISGTGAMTNYQTLLGNSGTYSDTPWYSYRSSINQVVIENGVTAIGTCAFYNCGSLTSVTILDSVTTIGSSAFSGCTNLTGIWVSEQNPVFSSDSSGVLYDKNKKTLLVAPTKLSGDYTIPDGVTTIQSEAFYYRSSLTSVTIPDSVTTIGNYAFYFCSKLTSLTIGNGVTTVGTYAFYGCGSLTAVHITDLAAWCKINFDSYDANPLCHTPNLYIKDKLATDITIPDGVTGIGDYAFYACKNLTSVTIPDSVTTIGAQAFVGCRNLTSVTIPDSVTTIGSSAFVNCSRLQYNAYSNGMYLGNDINPYVALMDTASTSITSIQIHNKTKIIGYSAFQDCSSLTSVTIPDSVVSIGNRAFYDCSSLTSVTVPDSVIAIGDEAFEDCSGLISVTIGNSVTTIGDEAFQDCSSLTSVTIPDSVITIGDEAFTGCSLQYNTYSNGMYLGNDNNPYLALMGTISTSITSIQIHNKTKIIGYEAFLYCSSLTSVTIPDSVTTIGSSAFLLCTSLTSVTIPDSVTTIGSSAFLLCTSLTSVTISNSVTTIGANAFQRCTSLTSVTIPDSVTTIAIGAFQRCTSLTSVTIPDSITTIGNSAFYGCSSLTDIYYSGTEAQWYSIYIDAGNSELTGATIYCKKVYPAKSMAVFTDQTDLRVAKRDKITLQARVLDEYGDYTDPSGITFQISHPSLVKIEATGFEKDCFYIQLSGINPGTTTVTFSDTKNGYVVAVPLAVYENSYPTYTLNNIPEILAYGFTANFANFNGLYIENCDYQLNDDQSVRLTFDVYNTNYTYGLVEVYDENGELDNLVLIDKMVNYTTGIKEVVIDGTTCFVRACFDQAQLTYHNGLVSKHTPDIAVDIPRNGYIKITCDPAESDIVALVNYAHLLVSALSVTGEARNFDPADTEFPEALTRNLLKTTACAQFKKDGSKLFSNIMKDEVKELTITPTTVGDFTDTLSQQLIDFQAMDLIKKSMADSGIGFAEDVFTKMLGMYGAALKTIFVIGKCENLVLSYKDALYTAGGGSITIQNQGGGMRAATQIKLESEVDFAPDVALQAYSVELDEAFLEFVQQADQETYDILTESICHTYNISLYKGDEKVQHSDYVTVYIPIPDDLRVLSLAGNVKVYRIEEDGSLTDMDAVVEDGCMRFITNHFSLYTLVGKAEIRGDIDGNGVVEREDVVQLLLHISMPSLFPIEAQADFDNNGRVEREDVLQLLLHISMPDMFPL